MKQPPVLACQIAELMEELNRLSRSPCTIRLKLSHPFGVPVISVDVEDPMMRVRRVTVFDLFELSRLQIPFIYVVGTELKKNEVTALHRMSPKPEKQ